MRGQRSRSPRNRNDHNQSRPTTIEPIVRNNYTRPLSTLLMTRDLSKPAEPNLTPLRIATTPEFIPSQDHPLVCFPRVRVRKAPPPRLPDPSATARSPRQRSRKNRSRRYFSIAASNMVCIGFPSRFATSRKVALDLALILMFGLSSATLIPKQYHIGPRNWMRNCAHPPTAGAQSNTRSPASGYTAARPRSPASRMSPPQADSAALSPTDPPA